MTITLSFEEIKLANMWNGNGPVISYPYKSNNVEPEEIKRDAQKAIKLAEEAQ